MPWLSIARDEEEEAATKPPLYSTRDSNTAEDDTTAIPKVINGLYVVDTTPSKV